METTQLTIIEPDKIQQAISNAPVTLQANTSSRDNALKAAANLIEESKKGMNAHLDSQMSIYIDKASKTAKAMNEKRAPFTQIMDALKKNFTSCENDIKESISQVKTIRDAYATQLAKEQAELERKRLIEIAKAEERILIETDIKQLLNEAFENLLLSRKKLISDFLNNRTLDNIDSTTASLDKTSTMFNPIDLTNLAKELSLKSYRYYSSDEVKKIAGEIADSQSIYVRFHGDFKSVISIALNDAKTKIPSKKAELLEAKKLAEEAAQKQAEIEKAKGEEKIKLEQEAAQKKIEIENLARERAERERLEAEQAAEIAKQNLEAKKKEEEAKAAAEKINIGLSSSLFSAPKVDVKRSYAIEVTNVAGYGLLFSFWLNNEGKEWEKEKIEKMTIERMKSYCEKIANTTGEIIDSEFITYNEVVKAK